MTDRTWFGRLYDIRQETERV